MLTTLGAHSGERRTVPVLAFADGCRTVVISDNHGKSRNPGWYHNLLSNPRAEIEVDGEVRSVLVHEAKGDERERLWREAVKVFPGWTVFERRAAPRRIPVIILDPAEQGTARKP